MKVGIFQVAICGLLSIAVSGCGTETTTSQAADHAEEEHLEHFVPEHKPADFSAAVDSVQSRIQQLTSAKESRPRTEELSELGEIIDWLPEIAANSDMRRRNWEQVDAITVELADLFHQLPQRSGVVDDDLNNRLRTTAEKLTPLKGTEKGDNE